MKTATVVIPHSLTTKWTQISVSSLLEYKNTTDFDILIIDNSYWDPSIKGITETRLGENVKVVVSKDPGRGGHQLALDYAIDLIDTPWFVAWETDVRVIRDGWLDWFLSFVKDEYVAIVGWYWGTPLLDDFRHYISTAGALYRTSILKKLKTECILNKDLVFAYGRDMSKRVDIVKDYPITAEWMIGKENWGPFCEARGYGNVYPFAKARDYWISEPGNWIYNRCSMQWECVKVPGEMVKNDEEVFEVPHKYTYIGESEKDAYYIHYWGGTACHTFKRYKIGKTQLPKIEWWLKREHNLWEQFVPEDVRKDTISKGFSKTFEEDFELARSQVE